jgi:hypothetical protein
MHNTGDLAITEAFKFMQHDDLAIWPRKPFQRGAHPLAFRPIRGEGVGVRRSDNGSTTVNLIEPDISCDGVQTALEITVWGQATESPSGAPVRRLDKGLRLSRAVAEACGIAINAVQVPKRRLAERSSALAAYPHAPLRHNTRAAGIFPPFAKFFSDTGVRRGELKGAPLAIG